MVGRDEVSRDVVGRDVVGRDAVSRDVVGRDVVGRDVVGRDGVERLTREVSRATWIGVCLSSFFTMTARLRESARFIQAVLHAL